MTQYQIENSFGSNVCRCTGFRPILDAFKTFAKDAPKPNEYVVDIEDLICKRRGDDCSRDCRDWCFVQTPVDAAKAIKIKLKDDKLWYRVKEVKDIFTILEQEGCESYMLVNGNTGRGKKLFILCLEPINKISCNRGVVVTYMLDGLSRGAVPIFEFPRVLIDIQPVEELKGYYIDQNLVVGAGTTLTNFMDILQTLAHQREEFSYLLKLYEHLDLVAHIPVRNVSQVTNRGFMFVIKTPI